MLKIRLLSLLLLLISGAANAIPLVIVGKSDDYCVTFCYIRIAFTITNYESARKVGMIYCDVDAEVSAVLVANDGETRIKKIHESPIGVFKNVAGEINGAVEIDTGIRKLSFRSSKVKSASCHL